MNERHSLHVWFPLMTPAVLPSSVVPPALLLPRNDLFEIRARRLHQLAEGHALGDWLHALGGLCEAQQQRQSLPAQPLAATRADGALVSPAAQSMLLDALPAELQGLLAALASTAGAALTTGWQLPEADELARRCRATLDWAAGLPAAAPRDRQDVLIAAALQSLASRSLRGLVVPATLSPLPGPQACPCCGSAAHAGVVLTADGKAGLRYLECSLCGSRWHAVRARCTLCDDPHEVTYCSLDGHHPGVHAETCDGCHGYIKTMFLDRDPLLDPLADDLATLALDVLVGEGGHARASPNLFLLDSGG